ncbi:MAG: hypothetical protein NYU05_01545 [Aigarchaeota archaeon]|nr:hypothetical protein [Candidatus Caldarchaeales archaeon]
MRWCLEGCAWFSSNPFAGRFFKKILTYRHEAIKHSLGAGEKPTYKDL